MEKLNREKIIEMLKESTQETTEDWIRDWILKAERIDFEYLINANNNVFDFEYRERQSDSDYRWEVYVSKQIFINENEKYRADIYIDMDYNFSNDLDEFIDEVMWLQEKAYLILS